jgi:hypothetical protein
MGFGQNTLTGKDTRLGLRLPLALLVGGFLCAILFATGASALPQQAAAGATQPQKAPQVTWTPAGDIHGKLSAADLRDLPDSAFAFPRVRKEPLTDAAHVRSALARFLQVKNVTDEERDQAFANIKEAAQHFHVNVKEADWRELGK